MLSSERLELALHIHDRSYRLLKWVADAIGKGFIPVVRAHQYANETAATRDWVESNYDNLPHAVRPTPDHMAPFSNFFSTYLMSSFDFVAKPGTRRESACGCMCPCCSRLVNASHLRAKTITKRDKRRAEELMGQRVCALGEEGGIAVDEQQAIGLIDGDLRRDCAFSTYGHWLIQRLEGRTDGPAVLALWREIAWKATGSPIPGFTLQAKDFIAAENRVLSALHKS